MTRRSCSAGGDRLGASQVVRRLHVMVTHASMRRGEVLVLAFLCRDRRFERCGIAKEGLSDRRDEPGRIVDDWLVRRPGGEADAEHRAEDHEPQNETPAISREAAPHATRPFESST